MKFSPKKSSKTTLSEKIADALTVKPRADIEDDQVFGTKPQTVSRADFSSSGSEDETAISDFRKRNVNLLSEISKKYEGTVVSRKELSKDASEIGYGHSDTESEINPKDLSLNDIDSDSDTEVLESKLPSKEPEESQSDGSDTDESHDYSITKFQQKLNNQSNKQNGKKIEEESSEDDSFGKKQILSVKDGLSSEDEASADEDSEKHLSKNNGLSEEDEASSDEDSEHHLLSKKDNLSKEDEESEKESRIDSEGSEDDEGYDISQMDEPLKEDFEHMKTQNVSDEAKKGAAVRNQLLIWEGLLEMRIHLQRCMTTANQMPMPDAYEELKENNEFSEECNTTINYVATILDKFMTLQKILFKNFPETKSIPTNNKPVETQKKEESDEEIPSDTDEEIPSDTDGEDQDKGSSSKPIKNAPTKKRKLEDYEKDISVSHKAFKSFRDTTIQKWNDKTRLATANIKAAPTNTILQQISYILSDKEKLVRRTKLKRSEYDIIGYKKPEKQINPDNETLTKNRKDDDEYIPDIFDDSDFYHQQLRELIECKSADISDPIQLSRQWIALQQMRSKMKRKVDTKATKGRKIKYVVHNQLVNFMAPEKCMTWNDESTNELYSSLFGKMFEQNNVGLNANLDNGFKLKK